MNNKTDKAITEVDKNACLGGLFGRFRAELWESDEYVITCKFGVIGHTIDKRTAQWLPAWLNAAMDEAMANLPNNQDGKQICQPLEK